MKLYSAKAIARILDLSERRVRQMKDQNIIREFSGKSGLYELIPTIHAYINYIRNRNPDSAENVDYNTERALLMQAKRRGIEFDLGLKERDLHTANDVETVMASMLINFKTRLMSIPAKLSPALSKKTDKAAIHRILKDSIDEALNELAGYDELFRRADNESGNT
ncbi:MAG: hypothetical protein FWH05_08650 [Oscillospiraceae bacterium]|nr:hypothetical protein [Oscillospiraceae bacterium]